MKFRKVCCATDELGKLWSVEYELMDRRLSIWNQERGRRSEPKRIPSIHFDPTIEQETSESASEDRADVRGRTSPCSVSLGRGRGGSDPMVRELSLAKLADKWRKVARNTKAFSQSQSRGAGAGGSRGPSRQNYHRDSWPRLFALTLSSLWDRPCQWSPSIRIREKQRL